MPGKPPAPEEILVVGAGIAGLVLAGAWAHRGGHATVLDAATQATPTGGGLQLAPPSVAALHGLGVDLRSTRAVPIQAQEIRDRDGRLLSRTPLDGCRARYGAPYLAVRRTDLHAALLDRVGHLADVEAGTPVDAVRNPEDPVVVLRDGRVRRATVVVGADGIHSVTRAALEADRPVPSGLWAHRALVPVAGLPPSFGEPVVRIWVGPGAHLVTYPVAGGDELNVVVVTPGDPADPRHRAGSWTAITEADPLRRRLAPWAPEVRRVLDAITVLRGHAVHDRPPIERIAHGRLALVGDAAHPMAPFLAQGANQAVEGAVELAAALRAPDREAGLTAYMARRAARAGGLQRDARRSVELLHLADGPAREERDRAWAEGGGLADRDVLYAYPVARLLGSAAASSA